VSSKLRSVTVLGYWLLVTICPSIQTANSQTPKAEKPVEWPCGGDSALLTDRGGSPVWIGFDELKKHAINAPTPTTPSPFRTSARVAVDIMIDATGRVACVRIDAAHPILKLSAAQTAMQWTFRPFLAGAHPVAVFGRLEFAFGAEPSRKAPRSK
jgi:hypothetical protein